MTQHDDGEFSCLWYFLPLPHPLGLPAEWTSERPLSQTQVVRTDGRSVGLSSSLIVRHLTPSSQSAVSDVKDLQWLALETMSGFRPDPAPAMDQPSPVTPDEAGPMKTQRTIFEVAIPGIVGANDEDILRGLDIAIDHARFVQRAVALATQTGVRLISRATLPPMIPIFRGRLFATFEGSEPRLPTVSEAVLVKIPGSAPPRSLGLVREEFDEPLLQKLEMALDTVARQGAFTGYGDLRREAMAQRDFDANQRMAMLALAAAGEVLLDTALLHMLWEEHCEPADAPPYFNRREGHTARVSKYFPSRVGGGWDAGAKTPAGDYLRDVVRLRHRVIHAGHEPTQEEVDTAWGAQLALERYLGDRLADDPSLNRYPRTAVAWMGDRGLESRGRMTRRIRTLMEDEAEPNWIESFARWRRWVDISIGGLVPEAGTDPDRLIVIAEVSPEGILRWSVRDEAADQAAVIDASSVVTPETQQEVEQHLSDRVNGPIADRRCVLAPDLVPSGAFEWVPEHELYLDLGFFPGTPTRRPGSPAAKPEK